MVKDCYRVGLRHSGLQKVPGGTRNGFLSLTQATEIPTATRRHQPQQQNQHQQQQNPNNNDKNNNNDGSNNNDSSSNNDNSNNDDSSNNNDVLLYPHTFGIASQAQRGVGQLPWFRSCSAEGELSCALSQSVLYSLTCPSDHVIFTTQSSLVEICAGTNQWSTHLARFVGWKIQYLRRPRRKTGQPEGSRVAEEQGDGTTREESRKWNAYK